MCNIPRLFGIVICNMYIYNIILYYIYKYYYGIYTYTHMEVSQNRGTTKWMVYNGNPIKIDALGVSLF